MQSEAAIRNLATSYAYDNHEDEVSLRSHPQEISKALREEVQDRLNKAGVHVVESRIRELSVSLELQCFLFQAASTLSTGQKQRARLACSIVKLPDLLILDEPTSGIDIKGVNQVLAFIRGIAKQGVSIILATHHLHEVTEVCNRVIYMDDGVIARDLHLHDGSKEQLRDLFLLSSSEL